MKENRDLAIKAIFALLVVIIMFLFALNGRYHYNSLLRIDKWTNKVEKYNRENGSWELFKGNSYEP